MLIFYTIKGLATVILKSTSKTSTFTFKQNDMRSKKQYICAILYTIHETETAYLGVQVQYRILYIVMRRFEMEKI